LSRFAPFTSRKRDDGTQGIFVSYRRQDSQSAAGRLADSLREHLPKAAVFRDVETIEPGMDFVDAINAALESCEVLLAVIGPRWISVQDEAGRRRLDDPGDYTRLELATALNRADVRVIPVLVEGAVIPAAGSLPTDLKALARRNALELTDKRWDFDVSQLVATLRHILGGVPAPVARRWPRPALAALLVAVVGFFLWPGRGPAELPDMVQPTPGPVVESRPPQQHPIISLSHRPGSTQVPGIERPFVTAENIERPLVTAENEEAPDEIIIE
jgi:hypothetical protein